jgi:hypothetical protein
MFTDLLLTSPVPETVETVIEEQSETGSSSLIDRSCVYQLLHTQHALLAHLNKPLRGVSMSYVNARAAAKATCSIPRRMLEREFRSTPSSAHHPKQQQYRP